MKIYTSFILLLFSCYTVFAQPFTSITTGLPAIGRSAVAFADFDNDNDLDLVMVGLDADYSPLGKVFLNQEGNFTEVASGISGLYNSAVAVADYNLDGNFDIVMTGQDFDGSATRLYRNTGNAQFELIEAGLYAAGADGDLAWGDYDNDGYPDLVISGNWNTKLYHNNGDRTFSFSNAGLVGTALGPADWIDYDNDGDLDIMLSGENAGCGNASTRLYTNNGVGSFDEFPAGLPFVERASSAWGDYDNDGDYDLLLTGLADSPVTRFYRNDLLSGAFQQNTLPEVPGDFYTYVSGDYAVISWGRSTDAQSPQMAITYNVMVGNETGAIDVLSPQANIATGARYAACTGNAGNNDFMVFRSLAPGDYYFRVQAIDQAFAGSPFSEEGSFTVLSTGVEQLSSSAIKAYISDNWLKISGITAANAEVTIISVTGQILFSDIVKPGESNLPLVAYPAGIYLVRIVENGEIYQVKLIK